jgi:hypothetical protein
MFDAQGSNYIRDLPSFGGMEELRNFVNSATNKLQEWGIKMHANCRLFAYEKAVQKAILAKDRRRQLSGMELGDFQQAMLDGYSLAASILSLADVNTSALRETIALALEGQEFPIAPERNARARNAQFELVTASILQNSGFKWRFAEPDLLVQGQLGEFGVAAKRLASFKQLSKRLKEACQQVTRANCKHGIVALDLTGAVNPTLMTFFEDDSVYPSLAARKIFELEHAYARIMRSVVNGTQVKAILLFLMLPTMHDECSRELRCVYSAKVSWTCEPDDPFLVDLLNITGGLIPAFGWSILHSFACNAFHADGPFHAVEDWEDTEN